RYVIAIDEFAKVAKQAIYSVLRRRDEVGRQRRIFAATEPILRSAKSSRPLGLWGIAEKLSIQLQQAWHRDRASRRADFNRAFHRAEISEDRTRGGICLFGCCRGARQATVRHLEALDPRRRDGLSTK